MSNPYTANAAELIRDVQNLDNQPALAQALIDHAQVNATLALAYEQRTANLLHAFREDRVRHNLEYNERINLLDELKERLEISNDERG